MVRGLQVQQTCRAVGLGWDVLSPSRGLGQEECVGKYRSDNPRGRQESLGLLEVLRSTVARWASVESQMALAPVLLAVAEPAATHQGTAPDPAPSATRGGASAERGVDRGFYERHPLRGPTVSDLEYSG